MPDILETYPIEELQELMRLFPEVYFDAADTAQE